MYTSPPTGALRRISLEELITKLTQIEEHASLALAEQPRGQVPSRVRLILGIAKQMRLHLEAQRSGGERAPLPPGKPASATPLHP